MLKDFTVTDSLGLEGFRVKGIWRLHDLGVKPSSACYELRMLQRDRVQWMTAADTPSCDQKKHTRWPATNSKYWCAIMRSEKTHTLTCNQFFGMQWITDAAVRSDAMNDGCWYAIVRSITYLSTYLSMSLSLSSVYLSSCLPVYLCCSVIQCNVVWCSVI